MLYTQWWQNSDRDKRINIGESSFLMTEQSRREFVFHSKDSNCHLFSVHSFLPVSTPVTRISFGEIHTCQVSSFSFLSWRLMLGNKRVSRIVTRSKKIKSARCNPSSVIKWWFTVQRLQLLTWQHRAERYHTAKKWRKQYCISDEDRFSM